MFPLLALVLVTPGLASPIATSIDGNLDASSGWAQGPPMASAPVPPDTTTPLALPSDLPGTGRPGASSDDAVDDPDLLLFLTDQVARLLACIPRWGAAHCVKFHALLLLAPGGPDTDPDPDRQFDAELADGPAGVSFEDQSASLPWASSIPEDLSLQERDARVNYLLLHAIRTVVRDSLWLSPTSSELQQRGTAGSVAGSGTVTGRRRKKKRWNTGLLLGFFVLAGTVIATSIGKTALVAGKALAVSALALMIAVVTGFRRAAAGNRGGGNANYEILATAMKRTNGAGAPQNTYPEEVEVVPRISASAQSLAYRKHHTRG